MSYSSLSFTVSTTLALFTLPTTTALTYFCTFLWPYTSTPCTTHVRHFRFYTRCIRWVRSIYVQLIFNCALYVEILILTLFSNLACAFGRSIVIFLFMIMIWYLFKVNSFLNNFQTKSMSWTPHFHQFCWIRCVHSKCTLYLLDTLSAFSWLKFACSQCTLYLFAALSAFNLRCA